MKRPTHVLIAPHQYHVQTDTSLNTKAGLTGTCMNDTETILIDDQLGFTTEKETVLHECIHGAWNQTNLEKDFNEEQQEAVVWALAPRLLALLRDNPKFVDWLTEVR